MRFKNAKKCIWLGWMAAGQLLSLIDLPTSQGQPRSPQPRTAHSAVSEVCAAHYGAQQNDSRVVDFTGSYFKEFPSNFHENESSIALVIMR